MGNLYKRGNSLIFLSFHKIAYLIIYQGVFGPFNQVTLGKFDWQKHYRVGWHSLLKCSHNKYFFWILTLLPLLDVGLTDCNIKCDT